MRKRARYATIVNDLLPYELDKEQWRRLGVNAIDLGHHVGNQIAPPHCDRDRAFSLTYMSSKSAANHCEGDNNASRGTVQLEQIIFGGGASFLYFEIDVRDLDVAPETAV